MAKKCLFNIILDNDEDVSVKDIEVEAVELINNSEGHNINQALNDYKYAIAEGMLSFIA